MRRWPGRHATWRRLPGGAAAVYRGPIWHIRRLWPHRKYPVVPLNTTDVRNYHPQIYLRRNKSRVKYLSNRFWKINIILWYASRLIPETIRTKIFCKLNKKLPNQIHLDRRSLYVYLFLTDYWTPGYAKNFNLLLLPGEIRQSYYFDGEWAGWARTMRRGLFLYLNLFTKDQNYVGWHKMGSVLSGALWDLANSLL